MPDAPPTTARFGRIPARWLGHPDIGIDELAVLAALAVHAGRDGSCRVRQAALAQGLKRSREWVNRVIARLCRLDGVLEKERRTDRDGWTVACRYRLPDLVRDQPGTAAPDTAAPDTADVPAGAPPEQNPGNRDSAALSPAREADASVPPADWQPDAADRAWLAAHRPDLDAASMTAVFVAGCRARGLRYADFSAAWRLWAGRQWPLRAASGRIDRTAAAGPGPAETDAAQAARVIARMASRRTAEA